MLPLLFEQTADAIQEQEGDRWRSLVIAALENTDRRIGQGKPVIPAFLYAVLLWRPFSERFEALMQHTRNTGQALHQAADEVFAVQSLQVSIPRRVSGPAIEMWEMQNALERRRPKSVRSLLDNRRFRAAYDFLMLRARIGEADQSLVDWWTRIQDVGVDERERMISEVGGQDRRQRGNNRKNTGSQEGEQSQPESQDGQSANAPGKKKRKRRPRKRRSGGNQSAGGNSGQKNGSDNRD